MPAMSLNLAVEQGATWSHGFIPMMNDAPLLDDTWTARAQARPTIASPEVLFEWSTVIGNIAIDDATGALTMTIDADESSAWTWKKAVWDLEVTSPDGQITYRVVQGRIQVSPEVTR